MTTTATRRKVTKTPHWAIYCRDTKGNIYSGIYGNVEHKERLEEIAELLNLHYPDKSYWVNEKP